MCGLFIYVVSGLFIFSGLVEWFENGWSKTCGYGIFIGGAPILIALAVFLIRPIRTYNEMRYAQKESEKKLKETKERYNCPANPDSSISKPNTLSSGSLSEPDAAYYSSSLAQAEIKRLVETCNDLKKNYDDLKKDYDRLISNRSIDEEATFEINQLTAENERLKSALLVSQNAVDLLNNQLEDLRKQLDQQ